MKKFTFFVLVIIFCNHLNAQILRILTSPSRISTIIPGYNEISTINTKTLNYTPSFPSLPSTPVDEDSTTEDDKLYHYADILPVNISTTDGNITTTSIGNVWTLRISIPNV